MMCVSVKWIYAGTKHVLESQLTGTGNERSMFTL